MEPALQKKSISALRRLWDSRPGSMRDKLRILAVLTTLVLGCHFISAQARDLVSQGRWKGSISIRKIPDSPNPPLDASGVLSSPIILRLLPQGSGGLLDIPAQSMFGYPLEEVSWTPSRLKFRLDALGPGEEMKFDGFLSTSGPLAGTIVGTASASSWKGSFTLVKESIVESPTREFLQIPVENAALPGTLELPPRISSGLPLVILLAGAGTTDRDGNNFNVPGKTDTLALLASELAQKGVASFRFDRRGAGEAYTLEKPGSQTSLFVHAADAVKIMEHFASDARFSRIVVAGMNEGAWIGAMAISTAEAQGLFVDGLVVLDASGSRPIDTLMDSLTGLDEAINLEAKNIIKAILDHADFPLPSEALSDFFSEGKKAWLESWLSFDPAEAFTKLLCPVLFIIGQKDLQVEPASFERLLTARPGSAARIIPGMNYALKEVGSEEENFKSFTSPEFPVPKSLVDLMAAFAKAKPAPVGTLPYSRSDLIRTNPLSQ